MKKYIMVTAAVLLIGGIIFYNSKGQNQESIPAKNNQPITIGVQVYPGYAPFYIAKERGLFKKYGVNVEIEQTTDNSLPALASGQIQMFADTSDIMPVLADAGIKAKQIFSTSKSNGADGLAVKNDIKSIKDLKGKKVYVEFGFPDHFFFRNLQKQAGVARQDIELVNLDAESAGAAFVAGKIDAAWTWEPFLSKTKQRKDGHILVTSRDAPELMAEDTVAARDDLIANRRQDVENIMRAFFEAVDWWNKNLDAGNAIAAKAFKLTPEEFAPTRQNVTLATLEINLEKFDKAKPWNVFEQSNRAAEVYYQDGIVKTRADADALTDASLLEDLGR